MAKCRNDVFMSKVGVNRINKQMEVDFDIQTDLPDCRKINANKYVSTLAENPSFNRYKTPENQFECLRVGCVNSGTLYNEGKETVYRAQYDATEFSAGVITFYALAPEGNANAVLKIANDTEFTDAWQYTIPLADMSVGADGFTAVVVDLTKTPVVLGEGWAPQETGAYISIEIVAEQGEGEEPADMSGVAISSIAIFDDIEDFATSSHVKLACLTSIDGSWDLDVAEATCLGNTRYNTDDFTGLEVTITGRAITPNYMKLNPFAKKGSAVVGWDEETIEKTVSALEDTDYGYITIADMNQAECGYFSAMLGDSCNIFDSQLDRLSIPSRIDVDEKHYQLIDNGDGTTTVLFNKEHIGAPMLISYPKTADVEETIFTEDVVNDVRTRVSWVHEYNDGTRIRFVFNNVLVTSMPLGISEDEWEIALTLNFQKDAKGNIGYAYRYVA